MRLYIYITIMKLIIPRATVTTQYSELKIEIN